MCVTLWSDFARSFDVVALHELQSPIVVVFAGFHISEFRGEHFLTFKNKKKKIKSSISPCSLLYMLYYIFVFLAKQNL
jgi:hypothetical protein